MDEWNKIIKKPRSTIFFVNSVFYFIKIKICKNLKSWFKRTITIRLQLVKNRKYIKNINTNNGQ